MRTDPEAVRAAIAGNRRTAAAALCLCLAGAAGLVCITRSHVEVTRTALVVPNPVYAAAAAGSVAPRALTATKTLRVPDGVAVAVEPDAVSVLRISVTAADGRTAQGVANAVLDTGLPAALRAQVTAGLRAREAAGNASPTVTAAEVDAAIRGYGLRVVTVSRAVGTMPAGAGAVTAVAVAQVAGLPASTPDAAVAGRLVVGALTGGDVPDAVVAARSAALEVRPADGVPAVTLVASSGSPDVAAQVAGDGLGRAAAALGSYLESSGLPRETLVLQPYGTPGPVTVRTGMPWWLSALIGLAAAAVAVGALLDRRDRRRRAGPGASSAGGRGQSVLAQSGRRSAREGRRPPAGPVVLPPATASGPASGTPGGAGGVPRTGRRAASLVEAAPAGALRPAAAGAAPAAPGAAGPPSAPGQPFDWTPVRLAEWGDLPAQDDRAVAVDWGRPVPMRTTAAATFPTSAQTTAGTLPTEVPRSVAAPATGRGAMPWGGTPTHALPTDAVPTDAVPTYALPTDAVPTDAVPTDAVPTDAVPTDAAPSPPLVSGSFSAPAPAQPRVPHAPVSAAAVPPTASDADGAAAPDRPAARPAPPAVVDLRSRIFGGEDGDDDGRLQVGTPSSVTGPLRFPGAGTGPSAEADPAAHTAEQPRPGGGAPAGAAEVLPVPTPEPPAPQPVQPSDRPAAVAPPALSLLVAPTSRPTIVPPTSTPTIVPPSAPSPGLHVVRESWSAEGSPPVPSTPYGPSPQRPHPAPFAASGRGVHVEQQGLPPTPQAPPVAQQPVQRAVRQPARTVLPNQLPNQLPVPLQPVPPSQTSGWTAPAGDTSAAVSRDPAAAPAPSAWVLPGQAAPPDTGWALQGAAPGPDPLPGPVIAPVIGPATGPATGPSGPGTSGEPGDPDRSWSDILGTGALPRRPARSPRFRGGRR